MFCVMCSASLIESMKEILGKEGVEGSSMLEFFLDEEYYCLQMIADMDRLLHPEGQLTSDLME